jgi:hypothetical protein
MMRPQTPIFGVGAKERMDKPRIFLGSSGKQEKLLQALTRLAERLRQ